MSKMVSRAQPDHRNKAGRYGFYLGKLGRRDEGVFALREILAGSEKGRQKTTTTYTGYINGSDTQRS